MVSVTSLTVAPVSKSCEEARQLGTRAGCGTLAAVAEGSAGPDTCKPARRLPFWLLVYHRDVA
jgi:hypothetical protein